MAMEAAAAEIATEAVRAQLFAVQPGSLAARVAEARAQQQRLREERALPAPEQHTSSANRSTASEPTPVSLGQPAIAPTAPIALDETEPVEAPGGASDDDFAALRFSFSRSGDALDGDMLDVDVAGDEDDADDADSAAGDVDVATASTNENTPLTAALSAAQAETERVRTELAAAQAELVTLRALAPHERAEDAALLLLLPLADDLDRALAHQPPALDRARAADHAAWVAGIGLIASRLHALLAQHDVCLISALGQPFDPHVHDAVAQLSLPLSGPMPAAGAPIAPHTVSAVYRAGYTRQQRVLRPAQVQVALPAPAPGPNAAPYPEPIADTGVDVVASQERAS